MICLPESGLAEALSIEYKCKIISNSDLHYAITVNKYESEHLTKTKTLSKYGPRLLSERMSRDDYY